MKRFTAILIFLIGSFTLVAQDQAESLIEDGPSLIVSNKIEVYPNPAVEYIIVEIEAGNLVDTRFEIHSLLGMQMTIAPEELGLGKYRIPVKEFSRGYYFVVVRDDQTRFKKAFKFLKN